MSRMPTAELTDALHAAFPLDLGSARELLERSGGGTMILHGSPGLEVRVEVLDAPGPGELRVEPGDTLYTVLAGSGLLGVAHGDPLSLETGEAAVVPGGTRHVLFGNPGLSVLVVGAPVWSTPTAPLALCRRH
jgi:quercetin dioxygenase-like cupin family protein